MKERRKWLAGLFRTHKKNIFLEKSRELYGALAKSISLVDAFQVCEYGRQPSKQELRELFPFLPRFR